MPGGNKRSHMLKQTCSFKYVWPFCYHKALKGYVLEDLE